MLHLRGVTPLFLIRVRFCPAADAISVLLPPAVKNSPKRGPEKAKGVLRMTEEKVRVKELAAELGVSNKDMLSALRELNITAKSHMAALTDEETAKVREHFAAPVNEAERRETRSGVIVRRRRRETPVEAPAAETASDRSVHTPTQAAPAPEAPLPEVSGEAQAPREDQEAAAFQGPSDRSAPGESASGEPAPVPAPVEQTEPQQFAGEALAQTGAKRSGRKSPTGEPRFDKPARIIQRPGEATPVSGGAVSEPAVTAVEEALPTEPEQDTAEAAAPAREQESSGKDAPAATKKPEKPGKSSRSGSMANLSAEPERDASGQALSSAPVLPPRSERETAAEGEDSGTKSSQVRVISRPGPNQARVVERPRSPSPRGDRPGEGGRFQPRGEGRGPAPRGDRPGGDRGGASRPFNARPGGGRPGFPPAGGPVPPSDADNRRKRQKDKRTVDFGGNDDFSRRRQELAGDDGAWTRGRRAKGRKKENKVPVATQPLKAAKRKIRMDEFIRVSDLAHQMGLKSGEIIKVLFGLGVMATINQSLDVDTATLVAAEYEYEVESVGFSEEAFLEEQQKQDDPEALATRPPVVTIMGHVDHGKTSLLDAIRKSSVVSGEAGGITQHIGAYLVKTKKGEIVFLDTPGHEAFTAMRARGAEVTDIVVLVVAADDGVMEQTREAISHSKAAGVPIMVAVNKMDKEDANPDRVKRELAEQGLVPEEWGGDTVYSYVSAKTRLGIDELMELLALQAEILELKANPDKPARGHIVEAKLDKGRGALGTVLIQEGSLKVGDPFVCGVHFGRVRAMRDDQGKKVKVAGPSMPVEVQGFEGVPEAGDEFISIPDEKVARRIAETRSLKLREKTLAKESRVTLETFLSRSASDIEALVLNLVVKADVQGSLEAISDALLKLSTDKVRLNIIHGGAGAISESDVLLASASEAIIIGFNVRPTPSAKALIEQEKVDIRFYDIIYKLVDEMKSAMTGMLAPVEKEVYLGLAEVRELFSVPKVGTIAGCHVADGKITRNAQIRLLRDNVVIHTGKIASLKRFKDDAREVLKGYECGIGLEKYNDLKVGDAIEAFEVVEEAATL